MWRFQFKSCDDRSQHRYRRLFIATWYRLDTTHSYILHELPFIYSWTSIYFMCNMFRAGFTLIFVCFNFDVTVRRFRSIYSLLCKHGDVLWWTEYVNVQCFPFDCTVKPTMSTVSVESVQRTLASETIACRDAAIKASTFESQDSSIFIMHSSTGLWQHFTWWLHPKCNSLSLLACYGSMQMGLWKYGMKIDEVCIPLGIWIIGKLWRAE